MSIAKRGKDYFGLEAGAKKLGCDPQTLKGMMEAGIARTAYAYDGPVIAEEFFDEERDDQAPRWISNVWVRGILYLFPFPGSPTPTALYSSGLEICTNLDEQEKFAFKFMPAKPISELTDEQLLITNDQIEQIQTRYKVPATPSPRSAPDEFRTGHERENLHMMLALLAIGYYDLEKNVGKQKRRSKKAIPNLHAIQEAIQQKMTDLNVGVLPGMAKNTVKDRIKEGLSLLAEHSEPPD